MTRDEIERKFPIGTKVRLIRTLCTVGAREGAGALVEGYTNSLFHAGRVYLRVRWVSDVGVQSHGGYAAEDLVLDTPLTSLELSLVSYIEREKKELGL